jgi:hypothetical protein
MVFDRSHSSRSAVADAPSKDGKGSAEAFTDASVWDSKSHRCRADTVRTMTAFDQALESESFVQYWKERVIRTGNEFLTAENIEQLRKLDPGRQLAALVVATQALRVSPTELRQAMPEEYEQHSQIVCDYFKVHGAYSGFVSDPQLYLFSLLGKAITENFSQGVPGLLVEIGCDDIWDKQADRLDQARTIVLQDSVAPLEGVQRSGVVSDMLKELLDRDNSLWDFDIGWKASWYSHFNNFVDKSYNELPQEEKARFLRSCLSALHEMQIFREFYLGRGSSWKPALFERRWGDPCWKPKRHYLLDRKRFSSDVYEKHAFSLDDFSASAGDYALQLAIRAVLKEFENISFDRQRNTALIVEFWDKNRSPFFANAVTDALSSQDVETGAAILMKYMQEERNDRTALGSILYRLELGKLGISEEGVRYLGRLYDLGAASNADFFAKRLTPHGQVGIFDEEEHLLGFFELGDLTDPRKRVRAKVKAITAELLFCGHAEETVALQERRAGFVRDFRAHYMEAFDDEFVAETGVRFSNLAFHEQGGWVEFVRLHPERVEEAYSFIRKFGESGLRAFLCMQQDGGLGDVVLKLGDRLSKESGAVLFDQYAEFLNATNRIQELVKQSTGSEEELTTGELVAVSSSLQSRGRTLLEDYYQKALKMSPEEIKKAEQQWFRELSRLQVEFYVLGRVLKESFERDIPLKPSMFTQLEVRCRMTAEITEDTHLIETIREFGRSNNKQYPEFLEKKANENIEAALVNPKARWWTLSYNGELCAYLCVMPSDPHRERKHQASKYWGSFNADPSIKGAGCGGAFLLEVMEIEGKESTLEALAWPEAPAYKSLYQRFFTVEEGEVKKFFDPLENLTHELVWFYWDPGEENRIQLNQTVPKSKSA